MLSRSLLLTKAHTSPAWISPSMEAWPRSDPASHKIGETPMSTEQNVQTVKDFFAAIGRSDREALLALVAEDIEWIIPGKDWPLAGTHRGHAGLTDFLQKAFETVETSTEPSEY